MKTYSIKKIQDPSCFWGIEEDNDANAEFNLLKNEIDSYFNDENISKRLLSQPCEGMRCIVRTDPRTWERGRIESVMVSHLGHKVNCYLVDKISTILVPSSRLYIAPAWVWELPNRGTKFSLDGVAPCRLRTDYHANKVFRDKGLRWSSAATESFKELVEYHHSKLEVKVVDETDTIQFVQLFIDGVKKSVNSILLDRGLAQVMHNQNPSSSVQSQAITSPLDDNEQKAMNAKKKGSLENFRNLMNEEAKRLQLILQETEQASNHDLKLKTSAPSTDISDMSCVSSSSESEASPSVSNQKSLELQPSKISYHNKFKDFSARSPNFTPVNSKDDQHPNMLFDNDVKLTDTPNYLDTPSSCVSSGSSDRTLVAQPIINGATKAAKCIGRGKPFLKYTENLPQRNLNHSCSPPSVQRKASYDLSEMQYFDRAGNPKTSENTHHSRDTESPLSNDAKVKALVDEIKATTDSLDILQSVEKIMNSPECIPSNSNSLVSPTKKKGLFLEVLLNKAKNKQSKSLETYLKTSRLPLVSKPASEQPILGIERQDNNLKSPVEGKGKATKEEGFFLSKMTMVNSGLQNSVMLVKGATPPNPISLFCEAPFPRQVVDTIEAVLKYRGPYVLQAYTWSAILERRHMVVIGPAKGGKTLSYVAPIVSMLQNQYEVLPSREGLNLLEGSYLSNQSPRVIVLCSTWTNVEKVTDYFKMFLDRLNEDLPRQKQRRVIGLVGGPKAEQLKAVDIISGCSVLVCSPHTLVRLCGTNFLNFTRLEQLVLDDFHVLVEEFTPQIRETMRMWSTTLDDPDIPKNLQIKPQIMCFGRQWTTGVDSFLQNFLSRPLLYISDPLEASVYGKVDHHVDTIKQSSVFDFVLHLLRADKNRQGGFSICVSNIKKMKEVATSLRAMSIPCLEAYNGMIDLDLQELQTTCTEGSERVVLVVCDDILSVIGVDTMEVVAHYDVPRDNYTLGLRLSLTRSFYHISKCHSQAITKPRSFMFLTENDDALTSVNLVEFLSRVSPLVPSNVKHIAETYMESAEICKTNTLLCPYLKAYGRCMDSNSCMYRHWLSKQLDQPNSNPLYAKIPTSGHVRLRVTNVKNATHFYAHLVKHRAINETLPYQYPNTFDELCKKLNSFYSQGQNQIPLESSPSLGKLYVVKVSEQYYRAKSVRTAAFKYKNIHPICWRSPAGLIKTRVFLVDIGQYQTVNVTELIELAPSFLHVPYQAVEVRSCNIRPVDQDVEWLFSANKLIHEIIFQKEIEGNVVLALGNAMWLEPVFKRKKLARTGFVVTEFDVVKELLQSGLAEKSPDHLKTLLEKCKEKHLVTRDFVEGGVVDELTMNESVDKNSVSKSSDENAADSTSNIIVNDEKNNKNVHQFDSQNRTKMKRDSDNLSVEQNNPLKDDLNLTTFSTPEVGGCGDNISLQSVHPTKPPVKLMISKSGDSSLSVEDNEDDDDLPPPLIVPDSPCSETATVNDFSINGSPDNTISVFSSASSSACSTPVASSTSSKLEESANEIKELLGVSTTSKMPVNQPKNFHSILSSNQGSVVPSQEKVTRKGRECVALREFRSSKACYSTSQASIKSFSDASHSSSSVVNSSEPQSTTAAKHSSPDAKHIFPERTSSSTSGSSSSTLGSERHQTSSFTSAKTQLHNFSKDPQGSVKSSVIPMRPGSSLSTTSSSCSYSPSTRSAFPQRRRFKSPVKKNISSANSDNKKDPSHPLNNSGGRNPAFHASYCSTSDDDVTLMRHNVAAPSINQTGKQTAGNDLPPRSDTESNELLYPYYVKLYYAENQKERVCICEELYIMCTENHMLVTEKDLLSLQKALMIAKSEHEALLLCSSALQLAYSLTPIENYISIAELIDRFCYGGDLVYIKLHRVVLGLCMVLFEKLRKDNPRHIVEIFHSLVAYLNYLATSLNFNDEQLIPISKTVLEILVKISLVIPATVLFSERDQLITTLSNLKSHRDTDKWRDALYNTVRSCSVPEAEHDSEEVSEAELTEQLEPQRRVSTSNKQKKLPAPVKKYDPLNYDRFNNIDTDTDSCCSTRFRMFTPIPVRFDSETESSCLETDTDSDIYIPGI